MFRGSILSMLLLAVLSVGCSITPPPKELVAARENYEKAEKGLAANLAPADLDNAKQALDRAEAAFGEEPEEERTKHLAYIADRKAQLASVNAGIERANRVRSGAEDKYKETTTEELAKARAELEAGKRELDARKRELDRERAARKSLEKRLKAAIDSLTTVAAIKEEARGVVITLSGAVLFASGKSRLLPIAKQKLNQVAKTLKDEGNPPLIVEGHTDASGSRRLNMALSQKRADAVAAHLMSRGYPASKIKAVGVGQERPVAENTSAEGRANNRRVEIVVTN